MSMIMPPITSTPIPSPIKNVTDVFSSLKDIASIFNSIEKICVSNNMCAVELAKIRCVRDIVCKKIEMKCAFDILQIMTEYKFAKIILNSKCLSDKTKRELELKIIEMIDKI